MKTKPVIKIIKHVKRKVTDSGQSRIYGSVPAFKQAESDNASKTLTWMAVIMTTLILGTGFLVYKIHAHPVGEAETLVSAMTRHVLGGRGLLLRAG